jgi:hypothetical protein
MQINIMHAEAARCFRSACEANDPLDQMLYISLRQAWLVLARQVEERAVDQKRLIDDKFASESVDEDNRAARPTRKRERGIQKRPSREGKPHRGKLAA